MNSNRYTLLLFKPSYHGFDIPTKLINSLSE